MNEPKGKTYCSHYCCQSNDEPSSLANCGRYFEIRIKGQLSEFLQDWFEGLAAEYLENGETLLSGYIIDQSALMGILNKLVRLNLSLISLNEKEEHKEKK